MPVLKRKLSTSGYVLIALLVVAIIALPILHVVGLIDLSFIGTGFEAIMMWAATDVLNGVLFVAGIFVSGALFFYVVKTYLLGTHIPAGVAGSAYIPRGDIPATAPASNDEVTVS